MANIIEETISAAKLISQSISGAALAQSGSKAGATQITVQVIPQVANSDFEAELQAAVNGTSGQVFTRIGTWTQDDDTLLSIFPISLNCSYRFVHISGASCRVLLVG